METVMDKEVQKIIVQLNLSETVDLTS